MHEQHDWRQRYADKVVTAEEAIRGILPGRRILVGSGAAEPVTLVRAMVEKGEHLADNEVVHLLTLGPAPYVEPAQARRFRHTAFFIGANVRQAVQEGRADFMPVFLSEIPELIRSRRVRIDVALLQVSPPDAHGYVSLGVSVDIVRGAVDAATLLIAEVNPNMPRTHGDSFLDVRRIHHLVPVDTPLLEAHSEPLDEVSRQIGAHPAWRAPEPGWQAHPRAALHREGRHGEPHPGGAGAGHGRRHQPGGRALRGDGVRRGGPVATWTRPRGSGTWPSWCATTGRDAAWARC
nr:hypothetical protein [Pyxidicoccus parkwaysis]